MKNHKDTPFFTYLLQFLQRVLSVLVLLMIPHLSYALSLTDFNLPPQNIDGWTILSPEADSRIVYVDSSAGNDSTGQIYSPGDSEVGSNPQSPTGPILAFQTLAAAHAQLRDDKPDWMLMKSGQVWEESLLIRRGESAVKRAVISSYGSGLRPELRTGALKGINTLDISNIIISGIKFWAHTRDSDGPYFQSFDGDNGFFFYTRAAGDPRVVSDALIEDCLFRAYKGNGISGNLNDNNSTPAIRIVIRRNIISGNYSVSSHSQGLFHAANDQPNTAPASVLLEDNIFDHNGWRIHSGDSGSSQDEGQATKFNHNTYFANAKKVMFINNIFLRASSIHNKWTANDGSQSASDIVVENNLYAGGEIGVSAGGNKPGQYRFNQFKFNFNVLTDIGRDQPTNRNLAWYLDIYDWDNGEIIGNLLLNQTAEITNAFAMNFTALDGTQKIVVQDNTIYNIESTRPLINFFDGANTSTVVFTDNVIQVPLTGSVAQIDARGDYQFNGDNGYFSYADPAEWFVINGDTASLDEWINYTEDHSATAQQPNWIDPERNIERYADEVGLGYSFTNFINALYSQSRSHWRSDLSAAEINAWFRAGFVSRGIQITSPADGATVTAGQPFIVTSNADSLANVQRVDFWHDDWDHFGAVTAAPFERLMNETLTGANPHPIRVRVTYTDDSKEDHLIFVNLSNANNLDTDGDEILDVDDNCTLIANTDQRDTDADGFGNVCDADLNNDGLVSFTDLSLFRTRFNTTDTDADFDGNGLVSFTDLNMFRNLFNQPPGPAGEL